MAESSPGLISGGIKWSGLASGTDFKAVVEQLVNIERRTITRQQTWQSEWEEKLKSINNLDTRLVALKLNAQDYDTRDELLSRAATSSKESVATITNTSTAATGVYSVEVGEKVREKLASQTYKDTQVIGGGPAKNSDGNLIDDKKRIIGTSNHEDANVLKAVAKKAGVDAVTFNTGESCYYDSSGNIVAKYDGVDTISLHDGTTKGADIATAVADNHETGRTEFVLSDSGKTVPTSETNPADTYFPPLTITMGGKTLTLNFDETDSLVVGGEVVVDDTTVGLYHKDMTMEQLAKVINNTVASDVDKMPKIKAELLYDRTKGDGTYSRLTIIGDEGGQKNHITVSDPTDLRMDRNSVTEPVTNSWLGSKANPLVDPSSNYTGHVNKTITVVVTNFNGNAELGVDDIQFSWADTEGNKGNFVVRAADWDQANDRLAEPIELLQGVKVSFSGKEGGNFLQKNEAFSIDCQTPVMQKAADIGLAQTDKWVHQGVPDQTSPVTFGQSGVFAYSYAGKNYSVNIPDGMGLAGLVDKINSDPNNRGVKASILNDGMGTSTSYKLVLTGHKEGAEYGIRVLDSTSLNRMPTGPDSFSHAREASNSMCRIDGYPNDDVTWIQRQTNEVGDVLDGVVMTLQGPGTSQITIQNNVTEMKEKIKQLVESINFCQTYIREQTKYGGGKLVSKMLKDGTFVRETESGKDPSGVMIGNYGFQIAQSTITRLATKQIFTRDEYIKAIDPEGKVQGKLPITVADEKRDGPSQEGLYQAYLEKHGLVYTRLTDIGIAFKPDEKAGGQYIIEDSKLTEALTKNPEAVIKLFTFKPPEPEIPLDRPLADEEPRPSFGGFAVNMGYAMSDLTRTTDVIDKDTGKVIKPAKGITKVLADNYNNIISGINDKIAREERRIELVRGRLEDKFTRLEVMLDGLNRQSTSIASQLGSLSGNSK